MTAINQQEGPMSATDTNALDGVITRLKLRSGGTPPRTADHPIDRIADAIEAGELTVLGAGGSGLRLTIAATTTSVVSTTVAIPTTSDIALACLMVAERRADELARERAAHDTAAAIVARMHEAAVGSVRGPIRGVVEDVQDLAASRADLRARLSAAEQMLQRPSALERLMRGVGDANRRVADWFR